MFPVSFEQKAYHEHKMILAKNICRDKHPFFHHFHTWHIGVWACPFFDKLFLWAFFLLAPIFPFYLCIFITTKWNFVCHMIWTRQKHAWWIKKDSHKTIINGPNWSIDATKYFKVFHLYESELFLLQSNISELKRHYQTSLFFHGQKKSNISLALLPLAPQIYLHFYRVHFW